MSNETITLVKDTALARIVAVTEILFFANEILALQMIIWPLFYTGAFFLLFNSLLTWLLNKLEKKLNYFWS
jgi:polar amino acid transport system permease protein